MLSRCSGSNQSPSGARCSSSGRASGSGAHPHEAPPTLAAQLAEPQRGRVERRDAELLGIEHERARAVEVPLPPVERARDLAVGERAAPARQPRAAMTARVVEGADLVVGAPHDEDRLVGDPVVEVVAGRRELLLATRDLPGARPQPPGLDLGERPGGVALLRDEGRAELPAWIPGHGAIIVTANGLMTLTWSCRFGRSCARTGDPGRRSKGVADVCSGSAVRRHQ